MSRKTFFEIASILFTLGLLIGAIFMICTPGIELVPACIGLLVAIGAFVANLIHVWKSRL